MQSMSKIDAIDAIRKAFKESNDEIERLEAALKQIAGLPYFYEETAWTWSDISRKQTDIARAALGLDGQHEQ